MIDRLPCSFRLALLKRKIRRIAASGKPVFMGPWRSEVGFEALYWLPMLRWAAKTYKIDSSRLFAVTRGGAGILYGCNTVDLYRLRSIDAVRLENMYDYQQTHLLKQMRETEWDRQVIKEAAAIALGRGEKYETLHPSWMYWTFDPFWEEYTGFRYLSGVTDYALLGPIAPLQQELPSQYVAMKWYNRATFPVREQNVQEAIAHLVKVVGSQTKIVLLKGTKDTDDHQDLEIEHPSIVDIPAAPPETNLQQQIQILGKAQAFMGPYGGMSQLALRMGIPTVSLWKKWEGTAHAHLSLSEFISKRTGVPFLTGSVSDLEGWRNVLIKPQKKDAHAQVVQRSHEGIQGGPAPQREQEGPSGHEPAPGEGDCQ